MSCSTYIVGAGLESRLVENPETIWDDIDSELGGGESSRYLSPERSLQHGPVWQSMNVIAEDVAQLPVMLHRRVPGGGKERVVSHPGARVLSSRANSELGPFQFKYTMLARALLWGNAYAWIERRAGRIAGLRPIEPGAIYPVRRNGELRYVSRTVDANELPEVLRPDEVFHLRGQGVCDLEGSSVIALARELINGAMDAEKYGSRFFRNNARPDVVLEFPHAVDGPSAKNILKRWSSRHAGPHNAGRPGFLDNGGTLRTYTMSNEDSQWLESRLFGKAEIAGWFKLPPHKIGHLERATFSNIEHQSIDYVQSALIPWLVRFQDEANYKLLSEDEQQAGELFFEFKVNALLRGDSGSRAEFYTSGVNGGWMTRNEVRSLENLNPIDGLDEPLQPLNMTTPGESNEGEEGDGEEASRLRRHLLGSLCRMLANAAQAAASKPAKFVAWADTDAREAHGRRVEAELRVLGMDEPAGVADSLFSDLRERLLVAADGDRAGFVSRVRSAADSFIEHAPNLVFGE